MRSWIYALPKAQLAVLAAGYGLEDTGTLDELRRRVREYAIAHPAEFGADFRERGEAPVAGPSGHGGGPQVIITGPSPTERDAPIALGAPAVPDHRVMTQLRKSGCHFDGRDPAAFLERLADLRDNHRIPEDQLLRGLPEVLRGDALLWFRNHQARLFSWAGFQAAFRLQFLPDRYSASLRREIEGRFQRSNETFSQYSTVMMTLMRRAGGYSDFEQLECLYNHMHPEYKFRIRIHEIADITDLQARAREHEGLVKERQEAVDREKVPAKPTVAVAYNRTECCWRCKQRGHTRQHCKRPARKFCSQCGRDGVLTKQCHPWPGNDSGAGATRVAPSAPSPV